MDSLLIDQHFTVDHIVEILVKHFMLGFQTLISLFCFQ